MTINNKGADCSSIYKYYLHLAITSINTLSTYGLSFFIL